VFLREKVTSPSPAFQNAIPKVFTLLWWQPRIKQFFHMYSKGGKIILAFRGSLWYYFYKVWEMVIFIEMERTWRYISLRAAINEASLVILNCRKCLICQ